MLFASKNPANPSCPPFGKGRNFPSSIKRGQGRFWGVLFTGKLLSCLAAAKDLY